MINNSYGIKVLVKAHEQELIRDYGQSSETTSAIGTALKRILAAIKR